MIKVFTIPKFRYCLPFVVVCIGISVGIFYLLSFLLPFTDKAFVVPNVRPVAADVDGYITQIYVKNGQRVKASQPLFQVFKTPYQLTYKQALAEYNEGVAELLVITEEINKNKAQLDEAREQLEKVEYEYRLKSNIKVQPALPRLEVRQLLYDKNALDKKVKSFQDVINADMAIMRRQQSHNLALDAKVKEASVNLNLTTVKASSDGIIDNMYLTVGTPIVRNHPIFSFIDSSAWWVQANFNEVDVNKVRLGDKAIVILRMYYFDKIFHGVVVNNYWPTERQLTASRSLMQRLNNRNDWLTLPQRLPLQIKILDPDPKFPLNPGASAYVYIQTSQ